MPKPEYKHDYYADLELRAGASSEDIKKQFKKLARLYHPDRNPGKADEYVPKFQAIQAAHEILTDPELRLKYDNDRRKYGYSSQFPRPPGPRGMNPMYQASSSYAPPPRRTGPAPSRPDFHTSASTSNATGADRWRNFGRPPTAQQQARDTSNINQAWRHMRPGERPPTGATQAPPPPPRPTNMNYSDNESAYARTNQKRPSPPSGYNPYVDPEEARARMRAGGPGLGRSQTVRTPRKGFDPMSADGDEGMAKNNIRFSYRPPPGQRQSDVPPEVPDPPTAPPKPDPLASFRSRSGDNVPFAEGADRIRTPYSTHIGEKTYFSREFSGEDVRRNSEQDRPRPTARGSKSRPTSRRTSPVAAARHHSSSPAGRKPRAPSPPPPTQPKPRGGNAQRPFTRHSDYDSSSSGDETIFKGRPKAQPGRAWANKTPPRPFAAEAANTYNAPGDMNGAQQAPPPNTYDTPFFPTLSALRAWQTANTPKRRHNHMDFDFNFGRSSSVNNVGATPGTSQRTEIPYGVSASDVPRPKPKVVVPEKSTRGGAPTPEPGSEMETSANTPTNTWVPAQQTSASPSGSSSLFGNDTKYNGYFENTSNPLKRKLPFLYSIDQLVRQRFGGRADTLPSFAFPPPPPQPKPAAPTPPKQAFRSKSDESMHVPKFDPNEWATQFDANIFNVPTTANAKAPRVPNPAARSRASSRPPMSPTQATFSGTTNGTAAATGAQFGIPGFSGFNFNNMPIPPPPPGPPPNLNTNPLHQTQSAPHSAGSAYATGQQQDGAPHFPPPPTPGGVKFSSDQWAQTFKDPAFVFNPQPPSPSKRPAPGPKKPSARKASKHNLASKGNGSAKAPYVVDVEDEEAGGKPAESADDEYETVNETDTGDGDAMEVDEEIPAAGAQANSSAYREPRNVPLQPGRQDWRDVQQQTFPPPPPAPEAPTAQTMPPPPPRVPRKPAMPQVNTQVPERNTLSDLKNVAPLSGSTSDGIDGLSSDLGANLPFPSQASSTHPLHTDDETEVRALDLPNPPMPPKAPEGNRITQARWNEYTTLMSTYFSHWVRWKRDIFARFLAQQEVEENLVGTNWLSAEGDAFDGYMRGTREDVVLREHFDTAKEKHLQAMEVFEGVRERVRRGGLRSEV